MRARADGKIVDVPNVPLPAPVVVVAVIAVVLGAAVGSFLNVVIYRVPAGESVVRPASHCPACGAPIRARHNIPVLSYLLLRGRCADCRAPISIRYPLVELATALLFGGLVLFGWSRGLIPLLPALLYLAAVGLALALIDIDAHRLPNAIVLPAYPVLAVLLVGAAWWSGDWWALTRAALGALALFGFYLLLVLVYPAGMGWGDVKLAGVLGAALGYVGWSSLVVGAFAGFLIGGIVAVGMIAMHRATGKTALPFGPFMILGAAVGIVWGGSAAAAYLGVLGA